MNKEDIVKMLVETFEDFKLSKGEKFALKENLKTFSGKPDVLLFARNKAFEMVKDQIAETRYLPEYLKWLEQVVKTIDSVKETSAQKDSEVYFSPGDECVGKIVSLIKGAKRSIDVCVFTISDDRISNELIRAHERGVKVRIISDNDKADDRGSDVERFIDNGMNVLVDNSPHHMHNKFALFDYEVLVNGSFNWTRSASVYNQENITVSTEHKLIKTFERQFDKLWNIFAP